MNKSLTAIATTALILKDVKLFLNDRRALLLNLVMPIVLAVFFGYLMGGSGTHETTKIEVAIVAQDHHVISEKILAGLKVESALQIKEMPLEQAQELVRKGKLSVAVVIPAGFGEAAGAALFGVKEKPELIIFFDPSQSATLAMVKGMLTQQVMQSVSGEIFGGNGSNGLIDRSLTELNALKDEGDEQKELVSMLDSIQKYQSHTHSSDKNTSSAVSTKSVKPSLTMPFSTKEEAVTAKNSIASQYNGYAHSFAGMIVQFILFMAIDVGIGVLLIRKQGIWNRMLAAPIGINTLIIARALSCALIAFSVICVIFAVAIAFFKVQVLGSLLGFVGIGASFSLMTASFGLLIAAFGKTPEAARGIAVFATLVLVMLGGAWMPSFLFPQWLQNFTIFIPTRWAVDGFDAMTWRGLGIDAAIPAIAALLAFTVAFGGLALWRFRVQQDAY